MNEIENILARRNVELIEPSLHVSSTSNFFMCKVRHKEQGNEFFFVHYYGQILELYTDRDYHVMRRYFENHADEYTR
jgi:hypothetical protein